MALAVGGAPGPQSYSVITGYGIYDRDILQELKITTYGQQALSWMRPAGRISKRKVFEQSYSHYESGRWFNAATTIAVAANTGTADVNVTLSTADHHDSGARSFPVKGQTVVFTDQTVGYVTAVNRSVANAHVVTITPMNSSQDVRTAAVVGTSAVFFGNAHSERSVATESRISKVTKITNYLTETREGFEATDQEMQSQVEFSYNGKRYLAYLSMDETNSRFEQQEEFNQLIGKSAENVNDPDTSLAVRTSEALIPKIQANGITGEYFGAPTLDTFDEIELRVDNAEADSEYYVGMGLRAEQKLRRFLVDFTQNGDNGISFAGMDAQTLNINFKQATFGSRKFNFHTWTCLTHGTSLGAAGMPYGDMMIGIPMGQTKIPSVEGQNGGSAYYLSQTYAPPKGALTGDPMSPDDVFVWETGALASNGPTDDVMTKKLHMVSNKGLEAYCLHKFFLWEKSE